MPEPEERLPPPRAEEMTQEQRLAVDRISAGPRGALVGPFGPLLHSPELMTCVQQTGEFLRFQSTLDRRLFEMTVLLVARHWNQQFEWAFHEPLAREAGLAGSVVDAIAAAERPSDMDDATAAVWDLVHDLHSTREVTDEHYAAAVAAVGERGVIEVVAGVGYYTTLAMVMNVARTPPPEGGPRLSEQDIGPAFD
jgi:4-carboxymuconolactone decarboxylase